MAQITEFEKLMDKVASGSEDAIWQLAETYTPYIVRVVRLSLSSRLRQKLDSQDVAQTLWASILLRRAELARLRKPEQLIAYLARAAKNKVVDKARYYNTQKCDISREESLDKPPSGRVGHNQRLAARPLYSRDPTPSTDASLRERLNSALSNATKRDRQIFELRLKGCTFGIIGLKLQIDESTARRAIHALVEQLSQ